VSDDDVLRALATLKRHGKLDDSVFFYDGIGRSKKGSIFLPSIYAAYPDQDYSRRVHLSIQSTDGVAIDFKTHKERDAFIEKWKRAKLARMMF